MSRKNPFTVVGNNGRISHKRFPRNSKAIDIKSAKHAAKIIKAMKKGT